MDPGRLRIAKVTSTMWTLSTTSPTTVPCYWLRRRRGCKEVWTIPGFFQKAIDLAYTCTKNGRWYRVPERWPVLRAQRPYPPGIYRTKPIVEREGRANGSDRAHQGALHDLRKPIAFSFWSDTVGCVTYILNRSSTSSNILCVSPLQVLTKVTQTFAM